MLTLIILSMEPSWVLIAQVPDEIVALHCHLCGAEMRATTSPTGDPYLECFNPACGWTVFIDTVPGAIPVGGSAGR